MNLIRRLFRPPNHKTPAGATVPGNAPAGEVFAEPVTELQNEAVGSDSVRIRVPDGVTRPLPPEPIPALSRNEHLSFGQMTDIGMVRSNNQDAVLTFFSSGRSADERPDFSLFVVADGMGGHHDGEKASALATRTLAREVNNNIYVPMILGGEQSDIPVSEILSRAVQKANSEVIRQVPEGGTTVTAVLVIGDLAYIVHVGDSRVYLMTQDGIEQVTRDHSLVQRLIELDQLTPEEAAEHPQKNVLYRALGQNDSLEVDTLTRRLPPNSRLVLCSDGLWNQVEDGAIRDVVRQRDNPQEACETLVEMANAHGGVDNVTVILVQVPS